MHLLLFVLPVVGFLSLGSVDSLQTIETDEGFIAWHGKVLNPSPNFTPQNLRRGPQSGFGRSTQDANRVLADVALRWPHGRVPYVIGDITAEAEIAVQEAIADYNKYTCIRLVPRTNETDHIKFVKEEGCWSLVGRQGGEQKISLDDGCQYKGTVLHEVMHALGWEHEQCRIDRDKYVTINWDNIQKGESSQFDKADGEHDKPSIPLTPYCYGSVMQYELDAFSKNKKPTMSVRAKLPADFEVGKAEGLNECDVKRIQIHYKCPRGTSSPVELINHSCKPKGQPEVLNGDTVVDKKFVRLCSATDSDWSFKYIACVDDNGEAVAIDEQLTYRGVPSVCKRTGKGHLTIVPVGRSVDEEQQTQGCEVQGQFKEVGNVWQNGSALWTCEKTEDAELVVSFVACVSRDGNPKADGEAWDEFDDGNKGGQGVRQRCYFNPDTREVHITPVWCVYGDEVIKPGCYKEFSSKGRRGSSIFVSCMKDKNGYVKKAAASMKRPSAVEECDDKQAQN